MIAWARSVKPNARQSMAALDGLLEGQPLDALAEQGGPNVPLEALVPKTVQPVLAQEVQRLLQLLADDQEPGLGRRARWR